MLNKPNSSCSPIQDFLRQHRKLVVITGAGVSTASGIPDYRDANGKWKHAQPMEFKEFSGSELARQLYWARSAIGRARFKGARPNPAHSALARLEATGKVETLITQNVDGLQQRAGSRNVIELHGSLDQVVCLECHQRSDRDRMQQFLMENNPALGTLTAPVLPDGDALFEGFDFSSIAIPACDNCGGRLKPDVVFYGENVPAQRVQDCFAVINAADALLIVGSSLMVYSGFRFARYANEIGLPIAAINQGVTRADDILTLKVSADCVEVLESLLSE